MLILDAHTHFACSRWEGHKWIHNSLEEAISVQKNNGVSGCVFCSWRAVLADTLEDFVAGNKETLEIYDKYPEYLYPGLILHPVFFKESMYFMDMFRERGLVWVGEMIPHKKIYQEFDDPAYEPLFKACADNNMIVQLHNSHGVPFVAEKFSTLQVVASHLWQDVLERESKIPNLMIDFSGMRGGCVSNSLTRTRALFGAKRMLYGTDFEGYDPLPFQIRAKRDFPESEQGDIFAGNLLRLLKKHNSCPAFGNLLDDK